MDLVIPFADDVITEETEKEHDDMTFFYGTNTRLFNDEISLATNGPLEKLSISVPHPVPVSLLCPYCLCINQTDRLTEKERKEAVLSVHRLSLSPSFPVLAIHEEKNVYTGVSGSASWYPCADL